MEPPAELPERSDVSHSTRSQSPEPVFNSVWNLENVYFKVEGEIFVVIKKRLLRSGSAFVDMFAMPSGSQPAEGESARNPIALEGVKSSHFSAFLSALYPGTDGALPFEAYGNKEILLGVLGLANMWRFPNVRDMAIQTLENTSAWLSEVKNLEKIRLGEQYLVEKWVYEGYSGIVRSTGKLAFGALEKPPYNFDHALAHKILHLRATAPLAANKRGIHPDLRTLLSEEIARAKFGQ